MFTRSPARTPRRIALALGLTGLAAALAVPSFATAPPSAPCSSHARGAREACAQVAALAGGFTAPGLMSRADMTLANNSYAPSHATSRAWSGTGSAAADDIKFTTTNFTAFAGQEPDAKGMVDVSASMGASRSRVINSRCYTETQQESVKGRYNTISQHMLVHVDVLRRLYELPRCSATAQLRFVRATSSTWNTETVSGADFTGADRSYRVGWNCNESGTSCGRQTTGSASLQKKGDHLSVNWNDGHGNGISDALWSTTAQGMHVTGRSHY